MPLDFLTPKERESYQHLPQNIEDTHVQQFFFLTRTDKAFIQSFYGSLTRVAIALQTCIVRLFGYLPDKWESQIDIEPVRFTLKMLGLPLSQEIALLQYGNRQATRSLHLQQILKHLNFRKWQPMDEPIMEQWLIQRGLERDNERYLLNALCKKLHQEKILRPAIGTLERIVGGIKERLHEETYKRLGSLWQQGIFEKLDGLLETDPVRKVTPHRWLCSEPTSNTSRVINQTLEKVAFLKEIKVTEEYEEEDIVEVPPAPERISEPIYETVEVEEVEEAIEMPRNRSRNRNNSYQYSYQKKNELRNYRNNLRNNIQSKRQEIKKKKRKKHIATIYEARFDLMFNNDISQSIAYKNSFKKSRDSKADAILWMKSNLIQTGLQSILGSAFRYGYWGRRYRNSGIINNSLYQANEDVSVTKLYFENDRIKFVQTAFQSKASQNFTKEVFSTKQDNKFFKYINGDEFIGYFSSSINTEAAIKKMPSLWLSSVLPYSPQYSEEFSVLAEAIEVLLDEKAIGEIASGNAFFVFKNMKEKEVKYKTYEYDENYKRKRVEKTKMEMLPQFLCMLSTENESLLTKVLGLGIKNNVLINKGDYYVTDERARFPMDLFLTIKDGIVFLSTDEMEIITICKGGSFSGLPKKHQKLATKNSQVVYFDNKKLMSYIPETAVRSRNRNNFNYYKENGFEEILFTTKNNRGDLTTEGFMNVPDGKSNSAEYLFEFLNQIIMH